MIHALLKESLDELIKRLQGKRSIYVSNRGFLVFMYGGRFTVPITGYRKGKGTILKVDPLYKGDAYTAKMCMKKILEELEVEPLKTNL